MPADAITGFILHYGYWILVPLAFLEGPIVAVNAGILSSLGYFNIFVVVAIFLFRDLSLDAVLYAVGHFGNRGDLVKRYAAKIGITEEHWSIVDRLWEEHPSKTMFLSKLAYGISAPFIISAGLSGMSYQRFWFYAIQVSLIQYGGLTLLGYFFGSSYNLIAAGVKGLELLALGAVVLSVGIFFFSKHMQRRLLAEEKKREQEEGAKAASEEKKEN